MQGITLFDASVDIAGAQRWSDLKANHATRFMRKQMQALGGEGVI
jgi:hypothetical protein